MNKNILFFLALFCYVQASTIRECAGRFSRHEVIRLDADGTSHGTNISGGERKDEHESLSAPNQPQLSVSEQLWYGGGGERRWGHQPAIETAQLTGQVQYRPSSAPPAFLTSETPRTQDDPFGLGDSIFSDLFNLDDFNEVAGFDQLDDLFTKVLASPSSDQSAPGLQGGTSPATDVFGRPKRPKEASTVQGEESHVANQDRDGGKELWIRYTNQETHKPYFMVLFQVQGIPNNEGRWKARNPLTDKIHFFKKSHAELCEPEAIKKYKEQHGQSFLQPLRRGKVVTVENLTGTYIITGRNKCGRYLLTSPGEQTSFFKNRKDIRTVAAPAAVTIGEYSGQELTRPESGTTSHDTNTSGSKRNYKDKSSPSPKRAKPSISAQLQHGEGREPYGEPQPATETTQPSNGIQHDQWSVPPELVTSEATLTHDPFGLYDDIPSDLSILDNLDDLDDVDDLFTKALASPSSDQDALDLQGDMNPAVDVFNKSKRPKTAPIAQGEELNIAVQDRDSGEEVWIRHRKATKIRRYDRELFTVCFTRHKGTLWVVRNPLTDTIHFFQTSHVEVCKHDEVGKYKEQHGHSFLQPLQPGDVVTVTNLKGFYAILGRNSSGYYHLTPQQGGPPVFRPRQAIKAEIRSAAVMAGCADGVKDTQDMDAESARSRDPACSKGDQPNITSLPIYEKGSCVKKIERESPFKRTRLFYVHSFLGKLRKYVVIDPDTDQSYSLKGEELVGCTEDELCILETRRTNSQFQPLSADTVVHLGDPEATYKVLWRRVEGGYMLQSCCHGSTITITGRNRIHLVELPSKDATIT